MKGIHKFDLITVLSLSLVTFGLLGFFYYTIFLHENAIFNDDKLKKDFQEKMANNDKEFIAPINIPRLLINLKSKNSRLRFLELELSIETIDKASQKLVEKYGAIIKDVAINIVGKMSPEELNSLSGKLLLEKRLKKKIREITQERFISRIFYRRFVVQ
jgi:flagellar protein FliL